MPISRRAELAAVGEGCRHVGVHACCIYRSKEALGSFDVLGDDALAVFGAVASNEVQSLVDVGHRVEGEFVVEPFAAIVGFGGVTQERVSAFECGVGLVVGIYFHVFVGEVVADSGQVAEARAVDEQAVERVADAGAACLGVEYNVAPGSYIARGVKVCVAYSAPVSMTGTRALSRT